MAAFPVQLKNEGDGRMDEVKAALQKLQDKFDDMRARVLLGQLAYLMDDAAAEYVYGEDIAGQTSFRYHIVSAGRGAI